MYIEIQIWGRQIQLRSRFLDEVDPSVVRTESGATINQKTDRFSKDQTSYENNTSTYIEYDWQKPIPKKTSSSSMGAIHYEYDAHEDPFIVGAEVMHSKFGHGKIISRNGLGLDAKAAVFFRTRGQKLMLRAAPLKSSIKRFKIIAEKSIIYVFDFC